MTPERLRPLAEALDWLQAEAPAPRAATVALADAAGRVLALEARAQACPPCPVAAIDGHAVRAAETEGASDYAPLPIGGAPVVAGAPLPEGADAVLPYPAFDAGPVALAAVARGSGVTPRGHDAPEGWRLAPGTLLTPLHLALLGRAGHAAAQVVQRPRVAIRVAAAKSGGDALTPLLHALATAAGSDVVEGQADLRIFAGRSGPGPDDDGRAAFSELFADGLALRPGETAAVGRAGGALAVLLPGDPLACATCFALLAAPMLRRLASLGEPAATMATLGRKITSGLGRAEAIRVRVDKGVATPVGPAEGGGLMAALAANGLVVTPAGSEGYPQGAEVPVTPL